MRGEQTQYKRIYDARVLTEPIFANSQRVFLDKPLLTAGPPTSDGMAAFTYKNLQHLATGPYKIFEVGPDTMIVDEPGVPSSMAIYRVGHAPHITTKYGGSLKNVSEERAVTPEDTR